MQVAWAQRGFSLLEVVIAAAILVATATAVTGAVASSLKGQAHADHVAGVDRLLWEEAERLRALPFCAPSYPGPASLGVPSPAAIATQVDEVFPHALASLNTAESFYVGAVASESHPAGSFVTIVERNGVSVTRVAWFCSGASFAPLGPDGVEGWLAWGEVPPPASALEVQLRAANGSGAERVVCVRVVALPAAVEATRSPAPEGAR